MFCPSCGNQCADDAKFCPACGYAFSQSADQPVVENTDGIPHQPVDSPSASPAYDVNTGYTGGYNSNENSPYFINTPAAPKKSGTTVLILGIVATVINSGLGCLCGCLGSLPGLVCAIIGLVLGFKAKKEYAPGEKDKHNEVGVILCFVALGIMIFMTIINAVLGGIMAAYNS